MTKHWKAELCLYQVAMRHMHRGSNWFKLKSDDALACYLLTFIGTVNSSRQDSQVEESTVGRCNECPRHE